MRRVSSGTLLLLLTALAGCSNAGEDLGIKVPKAGGLNVIVFIDRDNSLDFSTPEDTTRQAVRVRLLVGSGIPTLLTSDTTSPDGSVSFPDLESGNYRVEIDPAFLSDTLVATSRPPVATVRAGATSPTILVGLTPPIVTVRQLRTAFPVGKIVLVQGIISAGRRTFTLADSSAFLADTSGPLRLQRTGNLGASLDNSPGDLVRARGRIAVFHGQRVLDSARIYKAGVVTPPQPDTLTTQQAALAVAGTKDAALARVLNATIQDTVTTVLNEFVVGVTDGSGRLELRIDPQRASLAAKAEFVLGSLIDATGVLVPTGTGSWQLWPRDRTDYLIH